MTESLQELLMVGLAEAGKTSFVHAVDEQLSSPAAVSSLRSAGLASDRSYLERDKRKFRAGQALERTSRFEPNPVELWFEDPMSGAKGRLYLPDKSGEVYRDQWVNRTWDRSYVDALARIAGILLFIRADQAASNAEVLGALVNPAAPGGTAQFWDRKKASSQVQLVDVLQFIASQGSVAMPLRVAVMISAWDVVQKLGQLATSPDLFFRRDWALLSQYLETNPETFEFRVYGVSALGGTRSEMEEMKAVPPSQRSRIVEDGVESRDLTLPLKWLLRVR